MEAFAPAVKAAKSRGAIFLPQLQFPGRQVPEFLNPNPKSSSDQQLEPCLNKTYGIPSPLTMEEIKDLVRRYVWASEILAKAGADGIIVGLSFHHTGYCLDANWWFLVARESWIHHAAVPLAVD